MSNEISYDEFKMRGKSLQERYPYQFSEISDLEIPYGWIGVVETMCAHANAVLPDRMKNYFTFTQLKEKFGSGRFYCSQMETGESPAIEDLMDVDIHKLIERYEVIAGHTCFVCGDPARRVHDGWVSALCEEHEADKVQSEDDWE